MGRLRLGFAPARARLVAGCARAQFNFFLTVITFVDKEWCKLSAKTIFLSGPNKDRWGGLMSGNFRARTRVAAWSGVELRVLFHGV